MGEKRSGRISAFVVGALTGAIAGLLYAPRSGRETRDEIRRRAEDLIEQGRESYAEQSDWMRKVAADQAEQLRGRIEATRERLKSTIEAASDAAHEGVRLATDLGEEAVEKAAGIATIATQLSEKHAEVPEGGRVEEPEEPEKKTKKSEE